MDTFLEEGGTTVGVAPTERIESKIWMHGIYEGDYFDFIALGTKWVEGCYCLPNAALKGALESLTKNYKYVLIDLPAGLEHLNRRITSKVDDIFDVLDPSKSPLTTLSVRIAQRRRLKSTSKIFMLLVGSGFLKVWKTALRNR